MAIGRFRDAPGEMDEVELRVAAAQYPEGGLVLGACVGIVVGVLTVVPLLVVAPVVGSIVGYALGTAYRSRKAERLRAGSGTTDGTGSEPAPDGRGHAARGTAGRERADRDSPAGGTANGDSIDRGPVE